MKRKKMRRQGMAVMTAVSVILSTLPGGAAQAAAKPKLNRKSITLQEGKSTTLKLKGCKSKVKWSINKKKLAVLSPKGKTAVKVTAKKAGSAKITAKVKGKKYTCRLVVRGKKNDREQVTGTPNPATGIPAGSVTQTPGSSAPVPKMLQLLRWWLRQRRLLEVQHLAQTQQMIRWEARNRTPIQQTIRREVRNQTPIRQATHRK